MSISVHLDATTTSLFEKKKKKNRSQTDHSLLGRACGKVFCDNCASQRIELPADYGYDGPQRVCVKCQPALRDVQKQGHELEMTAIFYLRSTTAQFVRALPEVGWRSVFEKAFFTTKTADGATRVLELIDASKSPLALESESKRVAFKSLMSRLPTHPFISSFTSVAGGGTEFAEYFRDKDQLIVSTAVAPGGSVKDRIFNVANPLGRRYATKYGRDAKGRALTQRHCAYFGRHVLEALKHATKHEIALLDLHSGNVLVANDKPPRAYVALSAFASSIASGRGPRDSMALLGVDSTDIEAVNVRLFGALLFEMAAGFEKGTMPLYKWTASRTMGPVFDVLQKIFPGETEIPIEKRNATKSEKHVATLDELLAEEFFSQVPLSREELEALVAAKDWKPDKAERALLRTVPPTLPKLLEKSLKKQLKRNAEYQGLAPGGGKATATSSSSASTSSTGARNGGGSGNGAGDSPSTSPLASPRRRKKKKDFATSPDTSPMLSPRGDSISRNNSTTSASAAAAASAAVPAPTPAAAPVAAAPIAAPAAPPPPQPKKAPVAAPPPPASAPAPPPPPPSGGGGGGRAGLLASIRQNNMSKLKKVKPPR
jgi:hypothetical protein